MDFLLSISLGLSFFLFAKFLFCVGGTNATTVGAEGLTGFLATLGFLTSPSLSKGLFLSPPLLKGLSPCGLLLLGLLPF
ncbi:MAG: hypothetical protein IJ938_01610 [Clostridia bacterium]|nr:hypothetical protein [Clostridia bacterium]